MHGRGVRVMFLCEDEEHWRFARSVFLKMGYLAHELRVSQSPTGRGAAEQWVRQQYPDEIRIHRRKASGQNVGLVVVIDADTQSVEYRHRQLSDALDQADINHRGQTEQIVIWVPKRHIETWVADLLAPPANEEDDYKNRMRDADYRRAAAEFIERRRSAGPRPASALPSMARAFKELRRLSSGLRD